MFVIVSCWPTQARIKEETERARIQQKLEAEARARREAEEAIAEAARKKREEEEEKQRMMAGMSPTQRRMFEEHQLQLQKEREFNTTH